MNEKLKQQLYTLIAEKPLNYGQCCQSKAYNELKLSVLNATPLLNNSYAFKTRIFWILNDIIDFPTCYICGKKIYQDIQTLETGYNKNKKWQQDDINHITCKDKKCCNIKHIDNIKRACLEKYGVENVWCLESTKQKIKQTNLQRYGTESGGNTQNGRAKARKTWIEKYGVSSPLKNKKILEKVQQTCLKKYGAKSYTQTEDYCKYIQKKNLDKFLSRKEIFNDPEIIFIDFEEKIKKIQTINDFWNTSFNMKCKKCGNIFNSIPNINNFYKYKTFSYCQNCHPSYSSSIYEKQLVELFSNFNIKTELNSRKIIYPYELDIFIPTKKLAIEFDGLYWHSNAIDDINKNYHLQKTELCEKQGIQLIHIFENEWKYKQDIVKSRIKNLLGVYDNVIFARKCEVKEIDSKTSRQFQEENHIQGAVNSKVSLGLYYKDELISLMTFGKCRFDKKHEWELLRFCNKLGYHVPGAAGKLLKYFERNYNPKSLISYADRRWSQGKLYNKLGFNLSHISNPNYAYIINGKIESRLKYQKHKLVKILKKFDKEKTEVQNMKDNGYYRIFDCGNFVFEKIYCCNI